MATNRSPHAPHSYNAATWYMITGATTRRQRLLPTDAHLRLWVSVLRSLTEELNITLDAWVVLHNHYHVLMRADVAAQISVFIERLHARSTFLVNKRDNIRSRQVWYNHMDTLIQSDNEHWTCVNYVHENPVRHHVAAGAEQWAFSSYGVYLRTRGVDWLAENLKTYPIANFAPADDF
jgi:putative transposase